LSGRRRRRAKAPLAATESDVWYPGVILMMIRNVIRTNPRRPQGLDNCGPQGKKGHILSSDWWQLFFLVKQHISVEIDCDVILFNGFSLHSFHFQTQSQSQSQTTSNVPIFEPRLELDTDFWYNEILKLIVYHLFLEGTSLWVKLNWSTNYDMTWIMTWHELIWSNAFRPKLFPSNLLRVNFWASNRRVEKQKAELGFWCVYFLIS
jgi:hypothetical protein